MGPTSTGGRFFTTGGASGSGGSDAGPTGDGGGATGASGGAGGTGGTGGADAQVNTPGAPIVEMVSPAAVTDPDVGPVLVDNSVTVRCMAVASDEPGSNPVDASSVRIQVVDASGPVGDPIPGTPTNVQSEYSATVVLSSVPNGPISFECTASDRSDPPLTGSHVISTFVDHGPEITFASPVADQAYAVVGSVPFDFSILPSPLASGDDKAAVASIALVVNGVDLQIPLSATGTYSEAVPLGNQTIFPNTPSGPVGVAIHGTNARGVERIVSYTFVADSEGPQITVTSPPQGTVIGGATTIEFSVTDGAGVDPASVVVELNGEQHWYGPTPEWTHFGDAYSFTFDSRNFPEDQITINIIATDEAGNVSSGASVAVYVDNFPPIVDLDPGNVREKRLVSGTSYCSNSFDPLGISPNDLATVPEFITRPRALVWDQTNSAEGQEILYPAYTNPDSVYLYIQPTTSSALLVDTNNDGACDDLASAGQSFVNLQGIVPTGSSSFVPGDESTEPLLGTTCTAVGNFGVPATNLCLGSSDLTRVIRMVAGSTSVPVVYASPPINEVACTGDGWLVGAVASEGWLCLAARAVDNVGNVGISRPLRVCYDDGIDPPPACLTGEQPPSCTSGCTLPPVFDSQIIRE